MAFFLPAVGLARIGMWGGRSILAPRNAVLRLFRRVLIFASQQGLVAQAMPPLKKVQPMTALRCRWAAHEATMGR